MFHAWLLVSWKPGGRTCQVPRVGWRFLPAVAASVPRLLLRGWCPCCVSSSRAGCRSTVGSSRAGSCSAVGSSQAGKLFHRQRWRLAAALVPNESSFRTLLLATLRFRAMQRFLILRCSPLAAVPEYFWQLQCILL